jgi:hypothetical protein
MAIDNTPPRLKLIATIAVITVVTLIGINFVLESYYAMMSDEARHEKIAPTREKDEQHKAELAALSGASLPVDQAMAQLAKGTRPETISVQPSEDLAPMTGWSKWSSQRSRATAGSRCPQTAEPPTPATPAHPTLLLPPPTATPEPPIVATSVGSVTAGPMPDRRASDSRPRDLNRCRSE